MYRLRVIILFFILLFFIKTDVYAHELSNAQQDRANEIAKIVSDNWEEYGCLPSVCIAQAMIESTLGEHCISYNYWGINQGRTRYETLEDGVFGYMKCINNGYYKNAPFCENYSEQIRYILNGGYCQPVGDYYENTIWIIEHYELYKYDEQMFENIQKEKEEAIQKEREENNKERLDKEISNIFGHKKMMFNTVNNIEGVE